MTDDDTFGNPTEGSSDEQNIQTARDIVSDGGEDRDTDYQTTVDEGTSTFPEDGEEPQDVDAEEVRQKNRDNERSGFQKVADGLNNVFGAVTGAHDTQIESSANVLEQIAVAEQEFHDAQTYLISEAEKSMNINAEQKENIEQDAIERDQEIAGDTEHREEMENKFRVSLDGPLDSGEEVFDEHVYGAVDQIVNTNFLRDDVVKMGDVEDDSYTQGKKEGTSLPFIEQAQIKDSDAKDWMRGFNNDLDRAAASLEEYVDSFNLEERLDAYQEAMDSYLQTEVIQDTLEKLADAEEVTVSKVNQVLGDDLEELSEEAYNRTVETIAEVGSELNGREQTEYADGIDLNPEERQKAEELAHQVEARALDRAKLHRDRLDEAVEELSEFKQEFEQRKQQVSEYAEAVEDLSRLDGVGETTADVLKQSDQINTIMDIAARTDLGTHRGYDKMREESMDMNVGDPQEIIDSAYDELNEIADEFDAIDLEPTRVIQAEGSDLSGKDQVRRQMEAVYDSSERLERMYGALEGKIPELDQYRDPGWEGEEDTIEEERSEVYGDLGIEEPADAETALAFGNWASNNEAEEDYEEAFVDEE